MRNRLIELEHFRRLAGRKIPHLQNTVRVAEYTVQKRDEQIACLKQLVSGMQHQQKNDANVTSAKLAVSQTSIFQPPQPERRHSAGARSRSNSAPSVQEIQPVTDVTPILCAQKRRISILQNELVKARDVIETKDQRIKKAAAYKGRAKEEYRQLQGQLHTERQCLVKARREVRRLVGKRSEERMQFEKLQAEMDAMRAELRNLKSKSRS